MKNYKITAVCTFGLESVVKKEILRLGYEIESVADGAISIQGDVVDIYRLNLHLRSAERVYIELKTVKVQSFDELFDATKTIYWENYIPKDARFIVSKVSCVKSKLFSETDCQRIVKKAMVDRLMQKHKVNVLPEIRGNYSVTLKIKNDIATFYLNTSGEPLHKRGYRLQKGEAPIKETLASGILSLCRYTRNRQFADCMCGSGTFVIEAAMYAANIAPGLRREFEFENWGILNSKLRDAVREEAIANQVEPELRLLGSDINPRVIRYAEENAFRAGVSEYVAFQRMNMSEFKSRKKYGIMVLNPPYGERIGDRDHINELYRAMGKLYDELDDWSMNILCANSDFQDHFGHKADKNRKLYNGNMLSYLYMYTNDPPKKAKN